MTITHEEEWIKATAERKVGAGQGKITCPFCSETRKKKHDPCLSINLNQDGISYNCWHCQENGHIRDPDENRTAPARVAKPVKVVAGELSEAAQRFLKHRGISMATAKTLGVFTQERYYRKVGGTAEGIGFPYRGEDGIYAVKHRCIEPKDFSWDGEPRSLWNLDRVELEQFGEDVPLVIAEGEMDAISLYEAGVPNGVSVPHGAPNVVKSSRIDPKHDKKFAFIWDAKDVVNAATKIIICADDDPSGVALATEIARRVGKAKCWMVTYPDGCNDINDVLMKHGREAVVEVIDKAKPWPVAGLFDANHYSEEVKALYLRGPGKGESTGHADVDTLVSIVEGMVTVVTGIPGSGKSEWVDDVMYNLAKKLSWKFAVCSFENPPAYHIPKLAEKYTGLPFFEGSSRRMSSAQRDEAQEWVNDHFAFIDSADGEPSTIDSILERASAAVLRLGVRGIVIDPYNYLQMDRNESETNEISDMLTKVRAFATSHGCHVWFVAHPYKLRDEGSGVPWPSGYSISGSAAWFSKADLGITIGRPWMHSPVVVDETGDKRHVMPENNEVEVRCWKCRFKWMGRVGVAKLDYDPLSGRYLDKINWSGLSDDLDGEGGVSDQPWMMAY